MVSKYLIEEQTLTDIANSIRTMEKSTAPVPVEEYANRISNIEPSVEEYMRLSDLLDYPTPLDESNYTEGEINKVNTLIEHFSLLGGEVNGE